MGTWRGIRSLVRGLHASHGGLRRLVGGLWVGLLWAQSGGWGSSLLEADTVWLDLATTASWLDRQARRLNLREVRSGQPYPKGLLTKARQTRLLSLTLKENALVWVWQVGEDTFLLQSRRVSVRQLQKHLVLLRGPCAGGAQVVELLLVFRPRAKDLSQEEAQWGWQPFVPEGWESAILAPLALPQHYSPTAVTALSLVLLRQASAKPFFLQEVHLYGRKSAFLPRDEVVAVYRRPQLPKGFLTQLRAAWSAHPPYGYVIRINDYYPSSVGEGVLWVGLLGEGACVRPKEIIRDDGKSLQAAWAERLQGRSPYRLPLWEIK